MTPAPQDKHKWSSPHHIVNITGNKFYDWKQMKGGGGAIDLVMHVNKCDFKQAVAWLSERFGEMATIHQALELDRFLLFYQTIQPLQTDSSGSEHYEVLLRIEEPNGQIIPPMAFIPIAERYQLMNQIDRWVIRKIKGHMPISAIFLVKKIAQRTT